MTISKTNSGKTISINTSEVDVNVDYSDSQVIKIENSSDLELKTPGEFSIAGISYILAEVKEENYKGHINYAVITDEKELSVFVYSGEIVEFNVEDLKSLPDINVLVVKSASKKHFDLLLKLFTPEIVIIVKDTEQDWSKISANIPTSEEISSSFTIKKSDIETGEDINTRFIVLN